MKIICNSRPGWERKLCGRGAGLLVGWLALTAAAQNAPRIGYVFPAGGQAGKSFEAVVGGQFLGAASNISFTGTGIRATVVDFNKPMNQGLFNQLRDQMRELQEKKKTANQARRSEKSSPRNATNDWTAAEERRLTELREKILKNPPNRNATPAIAEVVTLRIEIAAGAAPGEREIRLGSATAFSNPLKFWVGQLPEFSQAPAKAPNPEANRFRESSGQAITGPKPEPEMRVTLPAVVNGQIMPGVVDRYRFRARRGQRLVLAAQARELIPYLADAVPGWFQAALTLYDAKGREVSYNDDFRFRPDPVLLWEAPADGEYVVEVKDAIYRGREDFVYRLTLGALPYVTDSYPLGGPVGSITQVTLAGWNLETNRMVVDARQLRPGIISLPVVARGSTANRLAFVLDNLPETSESEPNGSGAQAQPLELPRIVNGRIQQSGDEDVFRFHGRAGETVVAEVMARRLGSPLDSALTLTDTQGSLLAFNDDQEDKGFGLETHHADARVTFVLPEDGDYFLHLRDAQGKGSSAHAYRLRVSAPRPDFALRLAPSALSVRGGGSAPVTVYALRRDGFTNEIRLALKNAPPGFALSGSKIPAGQDQVKLTLKVPAVPMDDGFQLEMEGHATIAGHTVARPVIAADDLMQAFFYRHLVPAQEWLVTVAGRWGQRGAIQILSRTPVVIWPGHLTRVAVGFPREPFTDQIQFQLDEPPPGISIQQIVRTAAGADIILECTAATAHPGSGGNLIFTASIPRNKNQLPRNEAGRARQLATLPAVPFEYQPAENTPTAAGAK
jgi:hypothetical protein